MNNTFKSILTRLNNKGTVTALAALIVELLVQFGADIDSAKITSIINIFCCIFVVLGIMNDPTNNSEMYIPGVYDKLVEKKEDDVEWKYY